ncbi:MAG: gamma-glutamyl-gamma-aminobutyrate hydrolase family protein [Halobacteriaceae archaeon]
MTVLVIDNYDSFTYNLVEYVSSHGVPTTVEHNTTSLDTITAIDPDAIIISPGPGHPATPRDVGITPEVLTELTPTTPTLGVCLGMQAAVYEYGGTVAHAPAPVHGKTSPIHHDATGLYAGLDQGFAAGRYHSLACTTIPECFTVTATTTHDDTDLVMGVRHDDHPLYGVQFHPESVLTGVGHDLIANFLAMADLSTDHAPKV